MQNCLPVSPTRRFALNAVAALSSLPLLFLTGCPNLSQVQQLATTADGAKSSVNSLASDFVGSCNRQNLLINLPPGPPPEPAPVKACTTGDDLDQLGKNLIAEQSVLLDYFDALGKLSSADATGFEKEAPALNTTFKNADLTSTQQDMAGAAGTLAGDITKLATSGYRERQIGEILEHANDAVQKLTTGLANQIAPAGIDPKHPCFPAPALGTPPTYLAELCNEANALDSYYSIPLASEHDDATRILLRLQYQAALDQLHAREEAAIAYRSLMLSLGVAHSKLLSDSKSGNFNADAVKKIAQDLAGPMSDIASAVNTLQKDAR
jgi:hypothetical protein